MPTWSIPVSHQPELLFDGDLLVRAVGAPVTTTDQQTCHCELYLYANQSEFVPRIDLLCHPATEPAIVLAERVDTPESVEKFFLVFEPMEHLSTAYLDRLSATDRQALLRELLRTYDEQVTIVLKVLHDQLALRAASPPQPSAGELADH